MANVYMGKDVEDFIFGEDTVYESSIEESVTTDEEMDACGVQECVDDPEVACYRIALENEMNYNAIMNAMMSREFSVLESTGEEIVYEAENTKSFFARVKELIESFWRKVQGVFKKLIDMIGSIVLSNKKFVEKYKKNYKDIKTPSKKFKGYEFGTLYIDFQAMAREVEKNVDPAMVGKATAEEAESFAAEWPTYFDDVKGQIRAIACGDNSNVSADAFAKKMRLKLYGSEDKKEIPSVPFIELLGGISGAQQVKDMAKKSYNSAKNACKDLRSQVKKAESELRKSEGRKNPGMKIAKCLTDSINAALSIMSTALSMQSSALLAKMRQDRSMAAYYVQHQGKETKSANESAFDAIDNLVLI